MKHRTAWFATDAPVAGEYSGFKIRMQALIVGYGENFTTGGEPGILRVNLRRQKCGYCSMLAKNELTHNQHTR